MTFSTPGRLPVPNGVAKSAGTPRSSGARSFQSSDWTIFAFIVPVLRRLRGYTGGEYHKRKSWPLRVTVRLKFIKFTAESILN